MHTDSMEKFIRFSFFNSMKIQKIACNSTAAFFLSTDGMVYVWGKDLTGRGVLGLGSNTKQTKPCPLSSLIDYTITAISLSEFHACAIDSRGRVFTWGTDING